jgi:hypothetical protein
MVSEIGRLEKEIQELLARARDVDQKEDEFYGKDKDAHPIDEELLRRERRLEIIRKAKAELEEEARQAKTEDLREKAEREREAAATSTARNNQEKINPRAKSARRGRRCGQSWRRREERSCTPAAR